MGKKRVKAGTSRVAGRKVGRPPLYTEELAARICDWLSEGMSLRSMCGIDGMPTLETVRTWLRDKPEFAAQYARAREEQAETMAQEFVAIADEKCEDSTAAARNRLRVDARKWVASKLKPKVYGDKVELTGKDGSDLIPRKVHVHFPSA